MRRVAVWAIGALARVALWTYPPAFRRQLGGQIVEDVRRRAREFRGALAPVAMAGWLARLSASLIVDAVGAWRDELVARRSRGDGKRVAFSWLDVKLGLRMLVKYPVLTFAGGLGIAVAIALAGGFFAFSHAYLDPTIPLPDGDRLVGLENWDRSIDNETRRSLRDYYVWRDEMQSVEDLSAFTDLEDETITWPDGTAEQVTVAQMTPSGFSLAQVPPLLGRTLVDGDTDEGAQPVIVIGYDEWSVRSGRDPDILGARVRLGETEYEVVGVMPEGFAFPMQHSFWVPLKAGPDDYAFGEGPAVFISGRLADGFDLRAAQAELSTIGARMAEQFPDSHGHLTAQIMSYAYPLLDVNREAGATIARQVRVMNAIGLLVLLVVCLNVAVLVYARAAARRGEITIRRALGASRLRIVGQMFVETLVLCGTAAMLGTALIRVGLTQAELLMESAQGRPFWMSVGLSGPGVAYVFALTLAAALITGVLPGLQSTGKHVRENLDRFSNRNGPRLGRTWTMLIVAQIAVAVAAVPLATGMAWWEVKDSTASLAVDVDQFVLMRMGVHSPELRAELSRRLESDPDVAAYGYARGFPGGFRGRIGVERSMGGGEVGSVADVQVTVVGPRFLEAIGATVEVGRTFQARDWDEGAWFVAVVNRAFADRYLDGRDAVGKRYRYPDESGVFGDSPDVQWIEVIGVVPDLHENRFAPVTARPEVYLPVVQDMDIDLSALVRTARSDQQALVGRLRSYAAQLDPGLDTEIAPLAQVTREAEMGLRLTALVLVLAILAVVTLSAAGIYAMMSFTVSRRRREIGIRTALGANPRHLLGGIFGRALRQIGLGVCVGAAAALGLDRLAGGELLHGLGVPLVAAMVLLMGLVGLIAAVAPSRRGLRIMPAEVLSAE